jgi:hypothetical protein
MASYSQPIGPLNIFPKNYISRAAYLRRQRVIDEQLKAQLFRARTYRRVKIAIGQETVMRARNQMQGVAMDTLLSGGRGLVSSSNTLLKEIYDKHFHQTGSGRIPKSFMEEEIYRPMGLAAQRSVIAAFAQRRPRTGMPAYRTSAQHPQNIRYANGALLRALGSPDFFNVGPRGLEFINEDRLDLEAKHWRRLNFGTRGGAPLSPPKRFDVNWDGQVVASFGLDPDPRPAFRIPPGLWIQPGVFFPFSEVTAEARQRGVMGTTRHSAPQPYRLSSKGWSEERIASKHYGQMTKGIASTNFLDAGMRRLAREVRPAIDKILAYVSKPPTDVRQKIQVRVPVMDHRRRGYYKAGQFNFPGPGKPFPRPVR